MASLVNSVGNTCQSGEISRNISQVRYRYGEIFAKIVNVESNLRNVGTYYVNSGPNNQKCMRFGGQPGGIHRNITDVKGQCQQKLRKSIEL